MYTSKTAISNLFDHFEPVLQSGHGVGGRPLIIVGDCHDAARVVFSKTSPSLSSVSRGYIGGFFLLRLPSAL
jgi:hypothetical protein